MAECSKSPQATGSQSENKGLRKPSRFTRHWAPNPVGGGICPDCLSLVASKLKEAAGVGESPIEDVATKIAERLFAGADVFNQYVLSLQDEDGDEEYAHTFDGAIAEISDVLRLLAPPSPAKEL